jgi:hypothetical protein
MYLRFRIIKNLPPKPVDNTFAELYNEIHGYFPSEFQNTFKKTNFKVQINLVANRRVAGKPRQIHLKTLALAEICISDENEVFIDNNYENQILKRLAGFINCSEKQAELIKKAKIYFAKIEVEFPYAKSHSTIRNESVSNP